LKYLHLISGPRNISTALMYSFAQRSDTEVVDEPFYACYLSKTNVDHPGKHQVLISQSRNEQEVINQLFSQHQKSVLFIKNMAHHIEVLNDTSFLEKCTSIFLIRDPKQLIASYAQVIENPQMRDIGMEYEFTLFQKLKQFNPIVIDSGLLLQNPEAILKKVCENTGLSFENAMLHWSAGSKSYDGSWAPYWYTNVHQSTGFEKQPTSERPLPTQLIPLYEKARVFYDNLIKHAITP
jgi:hypothetical protein